MLQRTHVLLSLVLGVILMLSATSGLVLSGNTLVEHLRAAPSQGETVAVVAERIARKLPGIERIERAPSGELRVAFSNATDSDVVLVDPATAAVIAPYQPSAVLSWVRDLHRELLLGSAGRWLSGLSALALLLLSLSGSWLLARRLGGWRQLLLPINPGHGLIHWHCVVARWALPGLLILAGSGVYLAASSQGWISDGQDAEAAYPEANYSAPAADLASLTALRNLDLTDLRELEFPSNSQSANYYSLRTASGAGFVNASSGQWISYQPYGFAQRLYENMYELHTGVHSPLWSLALAGISLACLFISGSGLLAWWRRQRLTRLLPNNAPAAQAETIVLVGSQGGSTWAYARQLHSQLVASGMRVHSAGMSQLQPSYPQAKRLLILTATYGDGQAPDSARAFLARLDHCQLNTDVQVAVLGFGDAQFQHFCGYAEQVEQQLQQRGLQALLPLQKIDRGDLSELNGWAQRLGQTLDLDLHFTPVRNAVALQQLQLLSKEVYGEHSDSPAAILRFAVHAAQSSWWRPAVRFAPGDLVGISPGSGQAPRYYSIASSNEDDALEICVRKQGLGRCSSLLHDLQVGDCVEGFIQPHPDFRPSAGQHPLILVGAGTGLAPLIGFVRKNATQRPLHLYWGGRNAQSDFLYEAELSEYLADGRLTHLGLAFSQGTEGLYVQDRLRQDASALLGLFAQGAQVLVCGSKDMAAGVRAVLETLLAQRGSSVDDLRLQGRYREDVY